MAASSAYDSAQEGLQLGQMPLHVLRANGLLHRAAANGTEAKTQERQSPRTRAPLRAAGPRAIAAAHG